MPEDAGRATPEVERLREELRLRDAFLLALAHDLRSSIAAIAGASGTLRGSVAGGGITDDLLDVVDHAIAAIQVVIANLFDVERLRHGSIEVVHQPTDLADLLRRSVDDAGLSERVITEVEPATADLDAGLTERILWNLLTNAVFHAPADTPVTLCASCVDGQVLIHVEDAGPGIPPSMREDLFEPFIRGPGDGTGTGVGLFLVRQFARVQGGDAWIDERPGGGTAVHVRLPC